MKKFIMVLGTAAVLASTPQTAMAAAKTAAASTQNTGYAFTVNDTRIVINQDASDALSKLGKAKKVFEQDSCAYQGKDKVYSYDGFEISTYPVGKKEYVSSVYILDDTAQTEEGIKIGSGSKEVIKAYGKNYKLENDVYRYSKDGVEICFYMTNSKVDAIEYLVASK